MIKPPFPYFGCKSRVASIVWAALGDVYNYVEPFCGSCAVFLARPHPHKVATLNDKDGLIINFWRAVKHAPEEVAKWAAWPISEADLHARHAYIMQIISKKLENDPLGRSEFLSRLEGDPEYYDAQIAGYWVYVQSTWISGSNFGKGPWIIDEEKRLVYNKNGNGISRQRPHLGRNLGVNRKSFIANEDCEIFNEDREKALIKYFNKLAKMLSIAKITCGDWKRVCTAVPTYYLGMTGMFLDPPYSHPDRHDNLYFEDSKDIAKEVREYCLEAGNRKNMRIVLAGYEGEGHEELEKHGWKVWAWKGGSSYHHKDSEKIANRFKERLWFSPNCLYLNSLF